MRLVLSFVLLTTGCIADQHASVSMTVVDSLTGERLCDAHVQASGEHDETLQRDVYPTGSSSDCTFETSYAPALVRVTRANYQTQDVKNPVGKVTVRMQR